MAAGLKVQLRSLEYVVISDMPESSGTPSQDDTAAEETVLDDKMETGEDAEVVDKGPEIVCMKNKRFVVVSDLSETPAASQSSQRETTDDEGEFIILSEFPKSSGLVVPKALSKLFPAYSELKTGATPKAVDPKVWLNNESYTDPSVLPLAASASPSQSSKYSASSNEEDQLPTTDTLKPTKEKRRKKKDSKAEKALQPFPAVVLNFDGSERFYVDKKAEREYRRVDTLHRPACPVYHSSSRLGAFIRSSKKKKKEFKRYFSTKFQKRFKESRSKSGSTAPLITEDEFLETNKLLNQSTMCNVQNISAWVDLVQFQDQTPMKNIPKTQLAERKFDILNKALVHNPLSDELYTVYLNIANEVLPSFEVSKIVEKLLQKDPTNYILWRGLIMATQGSMARCSVPDVMKLYERAMQTNYRKRRCDETMLKLFQSCAFFLKQSGLYEQLFALIKLALELNVNPERFSSIKPSESDQDLLIEFEEVVLSSGLPMNEIWLRIEKLRTNFYYLPCPSGFSCSDPQRMVFNEDVCNFIFPLNCRENTMKLVFIILRLLKVPLRSYGKHREETEWDSIEDILPVFYQRPFCNDSAFDAVLWDLIKELNLGPSYFVSHIGHELYTRTVQEMLVLLASCFTGVDKMVLNLIWLRFERLLVIIASRDGKLSEEFKKKTRNKFKKFLKLEENRNEINYFVELASVELEMGNKEMAVGVLESSYNQGFDSGLSNKDKFYICVTLVEMYLSENELNDALKVLLCLGMGCSLAQPQEEVATESKKLVALAALKRNLEALTGIERNAQVMEEEQIHLPDYLLNSIKAQIYMETLVKGKSTAIATINELKIVFNEQENPRHSFIRENLMELQIAVKSLTLAKDPLTLSWKDFQEALLEYPYNLFIIKRLVNFKGLLWYKMKTLALKSHSYALVIFLIASVRLWYKEGVQTDGETHITMAHKYRVRSLLQEVVLNDEKLKKNAILWRLYLRILFELENSFNQCKNALFSALDECAWNKSLYLDGAVFVPHELTQIQDLIIEKQLRIYALPEELEILRKETV